MKKGQLIGVAIASLGVVASVGGALALFTRAKPVEFGFGKFNYNPSEGDLTYKLGAVVPAEDVVATDDTTITKNYKIPLSAVYPSTGVIVQPYRAGNISVSFSGDAVLKGKTHVTAAVKGYDSESWIKDGVTFINNVAYENDAVEASADVTVKAGSLTPTVADYQYLDITLVFTGTYLTFNEASMTLDVTWDEPSSAYKAPYIMGDANEWQAVEEYQMVKDIGDKFEQWTFRNLTGFDKLKLFDDARENKWIGNGTEVDSGNIDTDPATTYQVYLKDNQNTVNANYDDKTAAWYIS